MGLLSSLMYAAASVALIALILECCCRSRMKRLRESPQILTMTVVTPGPLPCPAPCPPYQGAPCPPPPAPPCSRPAVPHLAAPYPSAPNITRGQDIEAPPPSYEQVMAQHQHTVAPSAPR